MESGWGTAAFWRVVLLAYYANAHGTAPAPAHVAMPTHVATNAPVAAVTSPAGMARTAPPTTTIAIATMTAPATMATGATMASDATIPADATAALPATMTTPSLGPEVRPLLVRACYPCHSDERADPWYAKLAPSSWSTHGAREALNFSAWERYDDPRRARAAAIVAAVTDAGTMPPSDYTFFNHAARLNDAERQAVVRWASQPQR